MADEQRYAHLRSLLPGLRLARDRLDRRLQWEPAGLRREILEQERDFLCDLINGVHLIAGDRARR